MFQYISALEWEWAKSIQRHKEIAWGFRRNLPETLSHHFLQKVWGSGKEGYKTKTPDLKKDETGRHPQREILSPLEALHDHLLVTPPSHFSPQKGKGFVVGFIWVRGVTTAVKYSYRNR